MMFEECLYNLSRLRYVPRELNYTIRSWIFWLSIQENSPDAFINHGKWSRNHYWSYHSNKEYVASNFWYLINQGWIDAQISHIESSY